jgi:hypothetical protein
MTSAVKSQRITALYTGKMTAMMSQRRDIGA